VFGRAWVCVLPWVLVWRERAKASPPESLVFFAKEEQAWSKTCAWIDVWEQEVGGMDRISLGVGFGLVD